MVGRFGRGGFVVLFVLGVLAVGCGESAGTAADERGDPTQGGTTQKTVLDQETIITADNEARFSEDALVLATRLAGEPGIATDRVAGFEKDLRNIREKHPRLEDIHARPAFVLDEVLVALSAKASWRERWVSGDLKTGDAALDALLERYGANEVKTISPVVGGSRKERARLETYLVSFEGPLNIASLAREMESVSPEIRYAEPNGVSGDGDDIVFEELEDGTESYVFSEGTGDCLAGCIDRRSWTVTVDEDGGVSPLRQSRDRAAKTRAKNLPAPGEPSCSRGFQPVLSIPEEMPEIVRSRVFRV